MDKNQVTIDITADTSGLKRGTAEAKASVESLSRTLKKPSADLDAVSKKTDQATASFSRMGVVIGLSVAAAATAIFTLGVRTIDAADALNDMHLRTGVAVKDLAGLSTIAEQSGTSLDAVAKGMQYLSLTIGKAENGNKEYAKSLKDLGVSSKDPKEALYQLADAVKASNDPTRIAADLQKVLGRNYAELLPLLKEGGDGLRKSAQASESFAEAMSRLAPEADKFNDNLAQLKTNAAGFAATIMADLVPALNEMLDRFKNIRIAQGAGGFFNSLNLTGTLSKDLPQINSEIKELESTIARLVRNSNGVDSSISPLSRQLADLKKIQQALRAESMRGAMELAEQQYKTAPRGGSNVVDFASAAGRQNARSASKPDLWADDVAAAMKAANAEMETYAENARFVEQADLERANAVNALKQEWVDAGRALEESMITPQEELEHRLEYINELWLRGVINIETYDRAFAAAMDNGAAKTEEVQSLWKDLGATFSSAFEDAIVGGKGLSGVLKALEQDIVRIITRKAVTEPLTNWLGEMGKGIMKGGSSGGGGGGGFGFVGDLFGALFSARGNVFLNGGVQAFAAGGILDRPTLFPMRGGRWGVGGEAGTEAIMPVKRTRSGELGVRVEGGGQQQVVTNNFILQGRPDIRTQNQIAMQAARAQRRATSRFGG